MRRRTIQITTMPNNDLLTELVELFIYNKMSYAVTQDKKCTTQIKDESNEIATPYTVYRLSDDVFMHVRLLSNRAIASIYRLIDEYDTEI